MCGIACIVNLDKIDSENIHLSMRHRGPDSEGSYIDNNISIFHNRLAIQDLSVGASQPMSFEEYVIVLNGEIYNHIELRKLVSEYNFKTNSDTETLLYLFIKYGANCLDKIDGMFAFAILHKPTKKLFFARDRAGKKPFYYFKRNDAFFLASELNTINNNISLQIDQNNINSFLRLGFFYKEQTPFNYVKELPAGSYGWLDTNTMDLKIIRWWEITKFYESKSLSLNYKDTIDQLDNYLNLSVKRRIESSDLEVGSFLSGGIDSGLITAIAAKYNNKLKTYTVSFEGQFDESPLAQLVANRYNLDHTSIHIDYNNLLNDLEKIIINYGKPFFDSSAIPSFYISQVAKKHLTVVLNGDGGDELFGGYRRYIPFSKFNLFNLNTVCKNSAKSILKFLSYPNSKMSLYNYCYRLLSLSTKKNILDIYLSSTTDIFEDNLNCFINKDLGMNEILADLNNKKLSFSNSLKMIMDIDFNSLLVGDLLVKIDIATMHNSLEGRSPFLSKELLEFAPRLPNQYKIRNFKTKYILRELSKKYLPSNLINQPKKGFEIPLTHWVDNQLKEIIFDYLSSPNLASNFINKKFIKSLLFNPENFDPQKRSKMLWSIFTLEVWYKNYKESTN